MTSHGTASQKKKIIIIIIIRNHEKSSFQRRAYESVDDGSLSGVISQKGIRFQAVKGYQTRSSDIGSANFFYHKTTFYSIQT